MQNKMQSDFRDLHDADNAAGQAGKPGGGHWRRPYPWEKKEGKDSEMKTMIDYFAKDGPGPVVSTGLGKRRTPFALDSRPHPILGNAYKRQRASFKGKKFLTINPPTNPPLFTTDGPVPVVSGDGRAKPPSPANSVQSACSDAAGGVDGQ